MFKDEKVIEIKSCKQCNSNFDITDKDLEFYEKVSPVFNSKKYLIPSPTFCPDCRQQRRLSFRNERKLYKRKCDATGENIISIYSPYKPYKVYNQDFWWSDKWDPMDYGKDFDFSKSFFEQFDELMREFPRISLITMNQENSEYSNFSAWNKNSYLVFTSGKNENSLYSNRTLNSKNLLDCSNVDSSNDSYELLDCKNCNNSTFLINCVDSYNCHHSNNLIGCDNCFLCDNLVNKKYFIQNKEYSKDDYLIKIKEIKVENYHKGKIQKNINGAFLENCIGNSLFNSKNSYYCFEGDKINNSKYICNATNIESSYDVDNDDNSELVFESVGSEENFKHIFNDICWINKNISYSSLCFNSSNLFGCVGLKKQEYCILNKKYSKDEYEKLVPKIIEHMTNTGEYGEFFPSSISPFGYNETVAQEYFPLDKSKALENGFNWSDYEPPFPKVDKIIKASMLPEDISKIPDDILNWAIECEVSSKPFRIVAAELEFYRKHSLPIPKRHPDQRHLDRLKLRNPRKLFDRICDKCGIQIKTTYSPDRKELVYCESCYEKEVY